MKYYLGIDIGSVSTNVIAMDNNYNVCFNQYIRANGQPLESVKKGMTKLKEAIDRRSRKIDCRLGSVPPLPGGPQDQKAGNQSALRALTEPSACDTCKSGIIPLYAPVDSSLGHFLPTGRAA